MKSYRVNLKPKSAWGSPLHADTLFGHLCWALVYTRGETTLNDFLRAFNESHAPIVISNGFPKGFLPRPLLMPSTGTSAAKSSTDIKKLKRIALLSEDWLLNAREKLSEDSITATLTDNTQSIGDKDPWEEELQYHNTIDRWTNSVRAEGGFYQNTAFHLRGSELSVYVKTDYFAKNEVEQLLHVVAKEGFGPDKSAGHGAFTFTLSEHEFPRLKGANAFIALSNFVPTPNDPVVGWYDITTKFGKLGGDFAVGPSGPGEKHNPFKKPLIMLRSGSVFRDEPVREWYGGLVPNVHSNSAIRHYGISYPLEVRI